MLRSGLVITVPGQGQQLVKRRGEKKQELIRRLQYLSMRFKGIDPERFSTSPSVHSLVLPVPTMFCCLRWAVALSLIIVQFDVFHSRLPDFHYFFRAQTGCGSP